MNLPAGMRTSFIPIEFVMIGDSSADARFAPTPTPIVTIQNAIEAVRLLIVRDFLGLSVLLFSDNMVLVVENALRWFSFAHQMDRRIIKRNFGW